MKQTKEATETRFVVRSIEFPVVGVESVVPLKADTLHHPKPARKEKKKDQDNEPPKTPAQLAWSQLHDALRYCERASLHLANWCVYELCKQGRFRHPGEDIKKAPPVERMKNLYGHARDHYPFWKEWNRLTGSAAAVTYRVQRKVYQEWADIFWRYQRSQPIYRSFPFPVRAQEAKVHWIIRRNEAGHEDCLPAVTVPLAGFRFTLQLKGGADYRRQLAIFRRILTGEVKSGEVSLCHRKAKGKANHDAVFVRIAVTVPVGEMADRKGTMHLRTDPNAFIVAKVDDRPDWIENADHIRRWQKGLKAQLQRLDEKVATQGAQMVARHRNHEACLQRLSEDTKYEKRWPSNHRRRINQSRDLLCAKHRARLDSWNHEIAAAVANLAYRQKVFAVFLEDTCRSYIEDYPWHDFTAKLRDKLAARGITLTVMSEDSGGKEEPDNKETPASKDTNRKPGPPKRKTRTPGKAAKPHDGEQPGLRP